MIHKSFLVIALFSLNAFAAQKKTVFTVEAGFGARTSHYQLTEDGSQNRVLEFRSNFSKSRSKNLSKKDSDFILSELDKIPNTSSPLENCDRAFMTIESTVNGQIIKRQSCIAPKISTTTVFADFIEILEIALRAR